MRNALIWTSLSFNAFIILLFFGMRYEVIQLSLSVVEKPVITQVQTDKQKLENIYAEISDKP